MEVSAASNPFAVKTPEDISAQEARDLFVDVFSDFPKIRDAGHCIISGPRGSGKSMMFRYLLPDCQCLVRNSNLRDLPFLGVLVSIKNTEVNLTELRRLQNHHASTLLNEHLLVLYVISKAFKAISRLELPADLKAKQDAKRLVAEFTRRLRVAGMRSDSTLSVGGGRPAEVFAGLGGWADELYSSALTYARQLTFSPEHAPVYSGPLCGYLDFLVPVFEAVINQNYMPTGTPVFLLVDDADHLSHVQTRVLNSWIATRTSASISVKVSTTQQRYKTYQTVGRVRIEAAHDYSDVNIADLYTASQSRYVKRVRDIVALRLRAAGIGIEPEKFFPPDEEQEATIRALADRLKANWAKSGRGHRPGDDALRYARPDYIVGLLGSRKAGSTYSYSGFTQLVHISSGVIRYFLEPAAQMFSDEVAANSSGSGPTQIKPGIQDTVVRRVANDMMFGEYEKLFEDEGEGDPASKVALLDRKDKLHNLIKVLGGVFKQKLLSNDSERRVFSVALSDRPPQVISDVFSLGVQLGYFHRSSIGNKDGTGRTPLYVLTRRLAPYFGLDPTGFAGYLFVTSERLLEGIANPDRFLRDVKKTGVNRVFSQTQLQLFDR